MEITRRAFMRNSASSIAALAVCLTLPGVALDAPDAIVGHHHNGIPVTAAQLANARRDWITEFREPIPAWMIAKPAGLQLSLLTGMVWEAQGIVEQGFIASALNPGSRR